MAVQRSGPGFKQLEVALKGLSGVESKTGWFDTSHYQTKAATPTAYVAAIQEFGDGKIPPRPFMRPTVTEKQNAWMTQFGAGATKCLAGEMAPMDVMLAVARIAAGDIYKAIVAIHSPPLSLLTLALRQWSHEHPGEEVTGTIVGEVAEELHKGPPNLAGVSTKPLVFSGQLLRDLTAVAEKTK